jgi:hypothetical protein
MFLIVLIGLLWVRSYWARDLVFVVMDGTLTLESCRGGFYTVWDEGLQFDAEPAIRFEVWPAYDWDEVDGHVIRRWQGIQRFKYRVPLLAATNHAICISYWLLMVPPVGMLMIWWYRNRWRRDGTQCKQTASGEAEERP